MSELTVTISGPAKSGKSALALLIGRYLTSSGHRNVVVQDEDACNPFLAAQAAELVRDCSFTVRTEMEPTEADLRALLADLDRKATKAERQIDRVLDRLNAPSQFQAARIKE